MNYVLPQRIKLIQYHHFLWLMLACTLYRALHTFTVFSETTSNHIMLQLLIAIQPDAQGSQLQSKCWQKFCTPALGTFFDILSYDIYFDEARPEYHLDSITSPHYSCPWEEICASDTSISPCIRCSNFLPKVASNRRYFLMTSRPSIHYYAAAYPDHWDQGDPIFPKFFF